MSNLPSSFELARRFGPISDWVVEWNLPGIRCQTIRRAGRSFVWSDDSELLTDRFPEVAESAERLGDGTVLDGVLIAGELDRPQPASLLGRRAGRKSMGRKLKSEVPVQFLAFDLLEQNGIDLRSLPLKHRREQLHAILAMPCDTTLNGIVILPQLFPQSWDDCCRLHAVCRDHCADGVVLRRADSKYESGDKCEHWWEWKANSFLCNAVLLYAHRTTGGRSHKLSHLSFAVWDGEQLVPFAKTQVELNEDEMKQVVEFVRTNTVERFGPVCSLKPELVFELVFDGVQTSSRHKGGLSVQAPRISRWYRDGTIDDVDSLGSIRAKTGIDR